MEIVSERCLDKRFKIRKEAATGIAVLYHQVVSRATAASADAQENSTKDAAAKAASDIAAAAAQRQLARVTWIPGKVMQLYSQNTIEDKLLQEGIIVDYLVPKNYDPGEQNIANLLNGNCFLVFPRIIKNF